LTLRTVGGDTLRPTLRTSDRVEFIIPANGEVSLHW
jgi:hypothetical protein